MSKNTWFVGSMILLTFGTFIIVREQGWWNWNNGGIFKPNINFAEISGGNFKTIVSTSFDKSPFSK